MRDHDVIQMAQRCAEEIKSLRRIIAELEPKAEAYDTLRSVLNLMPRPSVGMTEDLVWRLEKQIAELIKNQNEPKGEPEK